MSRQLLYHRKHSRPCSLFAYVRLCSQSQYLAQIYIIQSITHSLQQHDLWSCGSHLFKTSYETNKWSILGSMMFNYSSMLVFEFLKEKLDHRPILLTLLGFICGRMMMLHFLSYLYHVDRISRVDRNFRRNPAFDSTPSNVKCKCGEYCF
nr:uncharacterized protein LOC111428860 isoform X3 [Onthophagus taurus]